MNSPIHYPLHYQHDNGHILIPETCEYVKLQDTGEFRLFISWPGDGEVILDYPGGPMAITSPYKRADRKQRARISEEGTQKTENQDKWRRQTGTREPDSHVRGAQPDGAGSEGGKGSWAKEYRDLWKMEKARAYSTLEPPESNKGLLIP